MIKKAIGNRSRLDRQRTFHLQQLSRSAAAPYGEAEVEQKLKFQLIHRGA